RRAARAEGQGQDARAQGDVLVDDERSRRGQGERPAVGRDAGDAAEARAAAHAVKGEAGRVPELNGRAADGRVRGEDAGHGIGGGGQRARAGTRDPEVAGRNRAAGRLGNGAARGEPDRGEAGVHGGGEVHGPCLVIEGDFARGGGHAGGAGEAGGGGHGAHREA